MRFIGPNGVTVLKKLGVWGDIMKRCSPTDLGLQGFVYHTGVGEHKVLWKVPIGHASLWIQPEG